MLAYRSIFIVNLTRRNQVFRQFGTIIDNKRYLATKNDDKQHGQLIYTGLLTSSLKRAKFLSLSSSVFGLAILPSLYNSIKSSSLMLKIMSFSMASIFIFITPILFQYVARKYVTKMYYDYETKQFTAYLFNFFLMPYKIHFNLNDVFIPQTPLGPFTTMKIKSKNRPLFINLESIQDKELLYKMYGYDKPLEQEKQQDANDDD